MYPLVSGCPPSYLARINSLVLSLLSCLCLCGLVCVLPMPVALSVFLNTPPSIWSQNPLDSLSSATHPSPLYEARRPAIFSIPARWSLQAADQMPPRSVMAMGDPSVCCSCSRHHQLQTVGCHLRIASGQLLLGGATASVLDAGALGAVGPVAEAIEIFMLGACSVLQLKVKFCQPLQPIGHLVRKFRA